MTALAPKYPFSLTLTPCQARNRRTTGRFVVEAAPQRPNPAQRILGETTGAHRKGPGEW